MRHKLYLLFTLMCGLCIFHAPAAAATDEEVNFTLLFSANVNGELEPCG
jgi:hypothetical protein